MWQTMYVAAVLQWDITKDPEKVLEEANSLFFGKAWEGGMKDFRKLLITAASTTPGCFGHGHRAPIGRCLSAPGVHQKLKEYLAKAEKAAASDPDKRILKNVLKDKEFFRNLWEKERERYLKDFRELKAYPKTSAIKIDGNIDEKDWKNADVVSSFKVNTIKLRHNLSVVWNLEFWNNRLAKLFKFNVFLIIFSYWNRRVDDIRNNHHLLL